jgi:hypothetical protein
VAIRYLSQKTRQSRDVQNQAAEVALRAQRRAGEVTVDLERCQGVRSYLGVTSGQPVQKLKADVLAEVGITTQEASRWSALCACQRSALRHISLRRRWTLTNARPARYRDVTAPSMSTSSTLEQDPRSTYSCHCKTFQQNSRRLWGIDTCEAILGQEDSTDFYASRLSGHAGHAYRYEAFTR